MMLALNIKFSITVKNQYTILVFHLKRLTKGIVASSYPKLTAGFRMLVLIPVITSLFIYLFVFFLKVIITERAARGEVFHLLFLLPR